MRLSSKQKADLETVIYFVPDQAKHWLVADEDMETYFAWSDKGVALPPPLKRSKGLQALIAGKTFREWHIKDYKVAIKEGTLWMFELVESMPESVGRYVVRSLGFGDYDMVKKTYHIT